MSRSWRSLGAEPEVLEGRAMVQAADLLLPSGRSGTAGRAHRRRGHLLSLPSSKSFRSSRTPRWGLAFALPPASWSGQPTLNRQLRMGILRRLGPWTLRAFP